MQDASVYSRPATASTPPATAAMAGAPVAMARLVLVEMAVPEVLAVAADSADWDELMELATELKLEPRDDVLDASEAVMDEKSVTMPWVEKSDPSELFQLEMALDMDSMLPLVVMTAAMALVSEETSAAASAARSVVVRRGATRMFAGEAGRGDAFAREFN